MPDILQNSDDLRNLIIDTFLSGIEDIEQRIWEKVQKLLDNFDSTGGKFDYSKASKRQLIEIQNGIEQILKDSGYYKAAGIYITDLAKLTQNTIDLQKGLNKLDITKSFLTGIEKVYADNAVQILSGSGLNENFIRPVTMIANEAVTFGYSIEDTRNTLKDFIVGGDDKSGKLSSYLTTTARDTVSQLQGAQNQAITNEYKMPYLRYVGGLLKDSRGQCVRWHGMQYIEMKDLQDEIDLALKNQALRLEQPKGHRWSGMMKDTTVDNFLIKRGGWGCLHQAIGVRRKG